MAQVAESDLRIKGLYEIIDCLEEAKHLAEDVDISKILEISQQHLIVCIQINFPSNKLAVELIQNASNIQCSIDQAEFLAQTAAALINQINGNSNASS